MLFQKCLKVLGFGGTSLPGLIIEKYLPQILTFLVTPYKRIILVTGTNGKTTAVSVMREVFLGQGLSVTTNEGGSNMTRGIATALLTETRKMCDVLILEVEEGTMPKIAGLMTPHVVVVTNIFRDQLDAYGEINKTIASINRALSVWKDAKLILNADDPIHHQFITPDKNVYTFSLGEYSKDILYEDMYASNGHKSTPYCWVEEVTPDTDSCLKVLYSMKDGSSSKKGEFTSSLPGYHSIYPSLIALIVTQIMGLDEKTAILSLALAKPQFGRGEKLKVRSKDGMHNVSLYLVKNPAGFLAVWKLLSSYKEGIDIYLGLNDNIADGKDVSWIWDIPLEESSEILPIHKSYFFGKRAMDMKLRFKYLDMPALAHREAIEIRYIADRIQSNTSKNAVIIATYTAMNEVRAHLKSVVVETIKPYTTI